MGIFGSPRFTKASALAMRAAAAFQDTRWFMNTFAYFPLSFWLQEFQGSRRENFQDGEFRNGCDGCIPCNPDNKHAARW